MIQGLNDILKISKVSHSDLTILIGQNGSGKSTFIQSMLLLKCMSENVKNMNELVEKNIYTIPKYIEKKNSKKTIKFKLKFFLLGDFDLEMDFIQTQNEIRFEILQLIGIDFKYTIGSENSISWGHSISSINDLFILFKSNISNLSEKKFQTFRQIFDSKKDSYEEELFTLKDLNEVKKKLSVDNLMDLIEFEYLDKNDLDPKLINFCEKEKLRILARYHMEPVEELVDWKEMVKYCVHEILNNSIEFNADNNWNAHRVFDHFEYNDWWDEYLDFWSGFGLDTNPFKNNGYEYSFRSKLIEPALEQINSLVCSMVTILYVSLEYKIETILKFNSQFISSQSTSIERGFDLTGNSRFSTLLNLYQGFYESEKIDEKLNYWIPYFGLGDKIEINGNRHVGQILLFKNNKGYELIDEGSGTANLIYLIMSIILQTSYAKVEKTIILEEPEANLHPNLQASLADFLVGIMDQSKAKFVIETHSEYFLRKLQYLVAKKEIEHDKIAINYFRLPNMENRVKVKNITIGSDGRLSDYFDGGFYDE